MTTNSKAKDEILRQKTWEELLDEMMSQRQRADAAEARAEEALERTEAYGGGKTRMSIDLRVLERCIRWLEKSSSPRMLKANLDFLYDRFILHPPKQSKRRATGEPQGGAGEGSRDHA